MTKNPFENPDKPLESSGGHEEAPEQEMAPAELESAIEGKQEEINAQAQELSDEINELTSSDASPEGLSLLEAKLEEIGINRFDEDDKAMIGKMWGWILGVTTGYGYMQLMETLGGHYSNPEERLATMGTALGIGLAAGVLATSASKLYYWMQKKQEAK